MMESIMTFLSTYPEMVYGLSVCLLTFIVLKYLIPTPTRLQKFITLIVSGISLGILFYFLLDKIEWPMMVLAFLASIGFYEMTIKIIMRKLHITYNDETNN